MAELFKNEAMMWIIGLFFTALTYMINKASRAVIETQKAKREQIKIESEEQKLIKDGVMALLRFRINRLMEHVQEQGYILEDERYDLQEMYKSYLALGGNGKTKLKYDFVIEKYEIRTNYNWNKIEEELKWY